MLATVRSHKSIRDLLYKTENKDADETDALGMSVIVRKTDFGPHGFRWLTLKRIEVSFCPLLKCADTIILFGCYSSDVCLMSCDCCFALGMVCILDLDDETSFTMSLAV